MEREIEGDRLRLAHSRATRSGGGRGSEREGEREEDGGEGGRKRD